MDHSDQPISKGESPQPVVVVLAARKSVGLAFLLAFLFGPLGLLYSSVIGGIVMFVLSLVIGIFTLGIGLLLVWPLCAIWAVVAANSTNSNTAGSRPMHPPAVRHSEALSATSVSQAAPGESPGSGSTPASSAGRGIDDFPRSQRLPLAIGLAAVFVFIVGVAAYTAGKSARRDGQVPVAESIAVQPHGGATGEVFSGDGGLANAVPPSASSSSLEEHTAVPLRNDGDSRKVTYDPDQGATLLPNSPLPTYPEKLGKAGIAGAVKAYIRIDASGNAEQEGFVVETASHELFAGSLLDALPRLRFAPGRKDGRPVTTVAEPVFVFEVLANGSTRVYQPTKVDWDTWKGSSSESTDYIGRWCCHIGGLSSAEVSIASANNRPVVRFSTPSWNHEFAGSMDGGRLTINDIGAIADVPGLTNSHPSSVAHWSAVFFVSKDGRKIDGSIRDNDQKEIASITLAKQKQ